MGGFKRRVRLSIAEWLFWLADKLTDSAERRWRLAERTRLLAVRITDD